eukprot:265126-Prymnesium_polylepis.1
MGDPNRVKRAGAWQGRQAWSEHLRHEAPAVRVRRIHKDKLGAEVRVNLLGHQMTVRLDGEDSAFEQRG